MAAVQNGEEIMSKVSSRVGHTCITDGSKELNVTFFIFYFFYIRVLKVGLFDLKF